ncbi:hypothetical protein [Sphingomonas radiodurans]|uniref:hypothetical protein n=1 Tax=Sphingomonas radiodurans TaxID=2890321 RepID=UPI001E5E9FA0|nr:hypothetical protein [Sphingomonas radiodurans]WBH18093.1 hypothetical protein LLW23_08375 [Sphingomonas radiodurans]
MGHADNPLGDTRLALTPEERARFDALIGAVDTDTLLRSLVGLDPESEDARLLIAAVMDRLPPSAGG